MPGRHITSRQVARYMQARQLGRSQIQSADFSERTERDSRPPGYITSECILSNALRLPLSPNY
jgi:hypothetical protein